MQSILLALASIILSLWFWDANIFIADYLVMLLMPYAGARAIVSGILIAAFIAGVPLGAAFALMQSERVLRKAAFVSLGAAALQVTVASLAADWWIERIWWTVPLECVALVTFFISAALATEAIASSASLTNRSRFGIAVYGVFGIAAIVWPWAFGCLKFGFCGNVA